MAFKPPDRKATEEILKKKEVQISEFVDYPGTKHGFAVRGSTTDQQVVAAYEGALERSSEFFKTHLNK